MASIKSEVLISEMVTYGVSIIKFVESSNLPKSVSDQLIRSATGIGTNFSEAQEAASRKDFLNKIFIAKKEAFETNYWLRIAKELTEADHELIDIVQKFLMILQKIVNTSRSDNGK